jgi:hypothetical protein
MHDNGKMVWLLQRIGRHLETFAEGKKTDESGNRRRVPETYSRGSSGVQTSVESAERMMAMRMKFKYK